MVCWGQNQGLRQRARGGHWGKGCTLIRLQERGVGRGWSLRPRGQESCSVRHAVLSVQNAHLPTCSKQLMEGKGVKMLRAR